MFDAAKNETLELPAISRQIWEMKYRFQDGDVIHDVTVEDTWRRIARALAQAEDESVRAEVEEQFFAALQGYQYLPAGRITAGAGTARNVTLFNCFVMGTIPDSMNGIFDMLKEAALTMQQGGGIGYDFSTIRPKGERVVGVGSDASGPLSFMDVWNAMCKTIMSAGSRRGAMMATMRCDHPDIEDFITAKADASRLRHFNLSVLITDPFMEAVFADKDWDLVWKGEVKKTVKATYLWDLIMKSTFDFAEPGVIFIDTINRMNNLSYCEMIAATNPCGEQALPPYGACLLGSINLATLVRHAFTTEAYLDLDAMNRLVATAVRMMDNVVDVSNFALEAQRAEAKAKRRIGLGVTGVADALLMLQLTYGTEEAALQLEEWQKAIQHAAYRASVELAKLKGAFPLFDAEKYLASPTVQKLDQDLQDDIRAYGIRNALLTSIAPTGTISLYAGNVSSGIEPVFAYSYTRKVLQKDGTKTEEEVVDYAVALYRKLFEITSDDQLPDYFVSAQNLSPMAHVRMQAAAQKWIDNSISKTINCPEDISFEDFKAVYEEAYRSGCKGCTTYRPNAITGSVLSVSDDKKKDAPVAAEAPAEAAPAAAPVSHSVPMPREDVLEGGTYKIKWGEQAYYVTVNHTVDAEGVCRPFEIFINTKDVNAQSWIKALTLMISAVFRRGGDVSFIVEELQGVFDARGGQWVPGEGYVKSLECAIGNVIEKHMRAIGFIAGGQKKSKMELLAEKDAKPATPALEEPAPSDIPQLKMPVQRDGCPDYGNCDVIYQGGCKQCQTCGWSACS